MKRLTIYSPGRQEDSDVTIVCGHEPRNVQTPATIEYERRNDNVGYRMVLKGNSVSWVQTVKNRITICCEYGNGMRTKSVY